MIAPGDLAIFRKVPDQPRCVELLAGKVCVLIRNLKETDGVTSSKRIWDVLVDGKIVSVHELDFEVLR